MKRPSFQFYPADWRNNAKLRRCSEAARGAWMDILCVLHDSDEYGVCRWPLSDLARAAGIALKFAKELAEKGVLKGADRDAVAFTFTPFHAGKAGDTVTLIPASDGPCWYCSRFVRDEWVRGRRGAATQFSETNQPPKTSPIPPIGERQGDGPSSSSSSTDTSSLRSDVTRSKPMRAKARSSLPNDFPAETDQAWAQTHWLQRGRADLCNAMTEEIEKFRDHHTSRATMSADWPGSWRTWARNALKFNSRQNNGPGKPTAHENFAIGAYLAADDAA